MAESIFMRVRRLISASVEDAVDAMERAGGPSVMREAIREVDRAIDEVRAEQEAASARRLGLGVSRMYPRAIHRVPARTDRAAARARRVRVTTACRRPTSL